MKVVTPRLHSHRRSTKNATNTHASASTTNITATSAKGIRYHLLPLEERALLATPYGAGTSYYELPCTPLTRGGPSPLRWYAIGVPSFDLSDGVVPG